MFHDYDYDYFSGFTPYRQYSSHVTAEGNVSEPNLNELIFLRKMFIHS